MKEKSVGRGFLILSIASILVKVLSAVYMPLLTNIITREGYGIYSASYQVFIFIFAITTMGAQPAITKVVAEMQAMGNTKGAIRTMKLARNYLFIIGFTVTIVFAVFAYPIANIFEIPESGLSLLILSPTIVLTAILTAYRGYLQGIEDMKSLAISQVIEQFINVIGSLIFAYLLMQSMGIIGGSAGGTVGTSLGAAIALVYVLYIYYKNDFDYNAEKNHTSEKKISNKSIKKKLIKYGLPITLVAAMQNAGGLVDTFFVTRRLMQGTLLLSYEEAVGKFAELSTFNTLIYVPLALVTALSMAIFPKIIQANVEKNKKELKNHVSYSFRLTYMITIPAVFGLAILSKEIYSIIFPDYPEDAYKLLMFGAFLLIPMSITTIQNTILQGISKLYLVLFTATIGVVIKIVLDYTLVGTSLGIKGAVIGGIIGFMIAAIINHIKLQGYFKVKIPIIKQAIVPFISSLVMAGVIWVVKSPLMRVNQIFEGGTVLTAVIVMILITVGGLAYLYVMVYLGGIRKRDLDTISPRLYSLMPRHLRKELL